jgi:cysteine synthase
MTTFTIEVPEKARQTLADVVEQLGGKVIAVKEDEKLDKAKKKLTVKEKEFLRGFDEAIEFVNQYKPNTTNPKTIDELLNEL